MCARAWSASLRARRSAPQMNREGRPSQQRITAPGAPGGSLGGTGSRARGDIRRVRLDPRSIQRRAHCAPCGRARHFGRHESRRGPTRRDPSARRRDANCYRDDEEDQEDPDEEGGRFELDAPPRLDLGPDSRPAARIVSAAAGFDARHGFSGCSVESTKGTLEPRGGRVITPRHHAGSDVPTSPAEEQELTLVPSCASPRNDE